MIDEKKLIEALEKRERKATAFSDIDWNSALKVCIDTVKKQPKVGEWIPCSERLPENNTNVIACFCTETVTELLYEGEGKFRGLYEYPKDVIVAWMPLPEPYKE